MLHDCITGPLETMLRSIVISRLGKCGDEVVIAEAKKRFQQLTGHKPNICGDLKKAVGTFSEFRSLH